MHADARDRRGFTLLELMAVFAIIAMVLAVTAPRLLPLAVHFGHEGAARELAAYGESVIQYAKLNNEELFVRFDLEKGEYWTEHWVVEKPEDGSKRDKEKPLKDAASLQESMTEAMNDPEADDESLAKSSEQMGEHFAGFAEQRLRAQADLVEPNRKLMDEKRKRTPDLFEGGEEPRREKQPLDAPMLGKRKLPEGVALRSVSVRGEPDESTKIEVVVTPLGIDKEVRMKLMSEDGDRLSVRWDPILGRGFVFSEERES